MLLTTISLDGILNVHGISLSGICRDTVTNKDRPTRPQASAKYTMRTDLSRKKHYCITQRLGGH